MADRLYAAGLVPGRSEPDPGLEPTERIEGGTELVEIERRGGWVRVATPDARALWVDGRRLAPVLDAPPEQPPAPPQVPTPTPVPAPEPAIPAPSPTPAPDGRRRSRRAVALWATLGVLTVAAIAVGVVLLVGGDDEPSYRLVDEPPMAFRGALELPVAAVGVHPDGHDAAYVFAEDRILRLRPPGGDPPEPGRVDRLSASVSEPAVGLRPQAVSAWGGRAVVLDGDDRLVVLDAFDLTFIEAADLDVDVEPLIWRVSRSGGEDVVVLFPRSDGLTDRLLLYGAESLAPLGEHVLPEPVSVTAITTGPFGDLWVGHTRGLLGFDGNAYQTAPDAVPGLDLFVDVPTPTAAVAVAWTVEDHLILALDAEDESIAVVRREGGVWRLSHTVDLEEATGASRGYDWTLAAVGHYAYVITFEGDLFIVDIRPSDELDDTSRVVGSFGGLGFTADWPRLMSLRFEWGGRNGGVFVAEPGTNRLWWIAPGVDHDPMARIPVTVE